MGSLFSTPHAINPYSPVMRYITYQVFRPLVRSSLKLSNPYPVIGSGTDSAVYHVAGEQKLLAERKKIGNIAPDQVAVTPAFTVIP